MSEYLKLAEKIYHAVKFSKGFSNDPLEDLNNLMIELRRAIKEENLKLLYNWIDFEELLMNSKNLNIDISILPKSKNSGEYILWLASFIEKVTLPNQELSKSIERKVVLPSYHYDECGNIVKKSSHNDEDIISYSQQKETIL